VRRRARYAAGGGFGGFGGNMGQSIPGYGPGGGCDPAPKRHEPKSAIALRHVIRSPRRRG